MILYFSATGNSMWVARRLADALSMPARSITDEPASPVFVDDRALVLVFPVHSWGPAVPMYDFVSRMPLDGYVRQPVYAVCVCGDDCGMTATILSKKLLKRGVRLTAAFSVQMPNNYILLPGFDVDSSAVVSAKLAAAPARLQKIVEAMEKGSQESLYRAGALPRLKSLLYPLFRKYVWSSNSFYATDRCTSCGKCERLCPQGIIEIDSSGYPRWQKKGCVQCSACIHRCPQRAIEYGRISLSKGRYHHPDCL